MKKTIIALLALAGVAVGADTIYTTTPSITSTANNYAAYGFAFNLSGTALTTTSNPVGITFGEEVSLTAISFMVRVEAENEYRKNGKYGIVITDMSNTILGWSTNAANGEKNKNFEWTFAPITLDTQSSYKAIAYDSAQRTLTKGETFTISSTATENKYMMWGTNGVIDFGDNSLDFEGDVADRKSGLVFLANNSLNLSSSTRYAPNVTITTKAIPEPASAALSLLALAGLAARRRRK